MGPVPSQRAALYLVNDLERLDGLLARLEGSDQLPVPGQRHVFGELSGCLAESARTVAGRGDPGGPADPPSPPSVDGFGLVARLSVVAGAITVHAGSYARSYGLSGHGGRGWLAGDGFGEFTVHAGRRFRANLTVHSVRLQDAVRLGLGLMVAVLTIHLLGLQHGFWVALATLSVVKSDARRTGRSLGEAVVGTAIGFGIAGPVIAAVGSRPGWLAALLPLTLFAAFYAKSALSFLVGQAAFTMAVLVMFNLLAPFGWSLGVVRLEDVVAGGLVGLAVGVLAWPRGADASIGWTGSRLVDTSARYLVAAVHARPAPAPGPGDPAVRLRQPALDASILADDVFAELLGEGAERSGVGRWAEVLSFGNRLRYAGDLVTTQRAQAMAAGPSAAARAAATHLGDTCHQLSVDLRAPGRSTGADRPVEPRPDPDPDTDDDLTRWMQDLTARACALLGPGPTERRSR
jgi:hypothetical protein